MPDNDSATIGYRWVCTRGKNGCEQCSALHDQEFYKNPHGTLRSVAEMPEPPIHPHCRCKLQPIIDPGVYFGDAVVVEGQDTGKGSRSRPILSEADAGDGIVAPGLGVFCTDGRSWTLGPAHGYYGGSNWFSGRNITGMEPEDIYEMLRRENMPAPVDAMDDLFQYHDLGYIGCEDGCRANSDDAVARHDCRYWCELAHDESLAEDLRKLPENPTEWPGDRTWTPEQIDYAKKIRTLATWYFDGVVATKRSMRESQN